MLERTCREQRRRRNDRRSSAVSDAVLDPLAEPSQCGQVGLVRFDAVAGGLGELVY